MCEYKYHVLSKGVLEKIHNQKEERGRDLCNWQTWEEWKSGILRRVMVMAELLEASSLTPLWEILPGCSFAKAGRDFPLFTTLVEVGGGISQCPEFKSDELICQKLNFDRLMIDDTGALCLCASVVPDVVQDFRRSVVAGFGRNGCDLSPTPSELVVMLARPYELGCDGDDIQRYRLGVEGIASLVRSRPLSFPIVRVGVKASPRHLELII